MINLEVLRLELNYLKTGVKGVMGKNATEEVGEAINLLVSYFLNPSTYTFPDVHNVIQLLENYLLLIKEAIGPHEYEIFKSNLTTIGTLIDKIKFEYTISL